MASATPTVTWEAVADYALGTCDSPAAIAQCFDMPEEDVEERLLDFSVEPCEGCGWWSESSDLAEEGAEGFCSDCRPGQD